MENQKYTYVILDQKTNMLPEFNVIRSTAAWVDYMKQSCKLRARIFFDEGMVPEDQISSDGLFIDRFDELSTHFLCFDRQKLVGAIRLKILSKNFFEIESCILESFEEFGYRHHHKVIKDYYRELINEEKKILEYSKLIVEEDYRLFKNPESTIALSLFSFSRFFVERNKIDEQVLSRGNKYQTKKVYHKLGFEFLKDKETGENLKPFWKYGDENDIMICSKYSKLFMRISEKFQSLFNNSITIIKK